ncbi:NfeD family protein [Tautonia marina]|uniref:NfeD family protein n=1 Tax=Tautonia marina TaxID=2653855 RepID=UPI0012609EFF|nr:NfeD family protein [Tautonia marina]
MSTFFMFCAILGGTILALQLGLTLLGIGGDLGGEGLDLPDLPDGDGADSTVGHDSGGFSDLAKRITFQGVVSFITFFGVGGLAAQGSGVSAPGSLLAAALVGSLATAVLAFAFAGVRKLQGSGSIHMDNAVGEVGRVYLRVPGGNGGVGKVIVPVQGRSEEVRAVTSGPELRPGEAVVVVHAIDDRTLEVVAQSAYVAKTASLAE